MANTYNAQLAKNVGQAQGTQFVDIAGSFSKAFDARVDEAVKTNREADDKRSEWEGEAINFDVDVNGDSPEVAAAKMEEAEKFRKQWLADIQVGDPFDPNKRRKLEEYKSRIGQLNQSSQYLEALKKDNVANAENISPANDPEAYQRMQELLKSKPIWDEKTKKYGYAVGDTIKTRAQLEKDILDIIEVPSVGMSNIYSAFAKGSGIEKKVDPNDPTKYGYSWIHAKPVLEAEIMAQANDKAYGKDFIYHSLSQGDGMYVKNPKYANLTKSEMDAKAEFELRESGRLSINDKDPVVIKGKINSYLKEQVVDSYLNGFKEENKDSIIEPKPEKQTTYKPTALQEEIAANAPIVKEANKFISDLNKKGATLKGDDKVKEIIKKIKSFDPENEVPLLTRGEAFKKFVEMENNRLKGLTEEERNAEFGMVEEKGKKPKQRKWANPEVMREKFRKLIGEKPGRKVDGKNVPAKTPGSGNQIFQFDEFDDGTFEFKPLPVNTKSDKSVQEFMVNYMGMSDKAKASFKSKVALFK